MDPVRGLDDLRSLLDTPAAAVLVTHTSDGSADVSPVWLRFTGEAFEVVVARSDVKLRHLEHDPRAVLMDLTAILPAEPEGTTGRGCTCSTAPSI